MDFAFLGWINKHGTFGVLKTGLAIERCFFNLFEKIEFQ
jgi:hypothetical protein